MATKASKVKARTEEVVEMKHVKTTPGTQVYGTDEDGVICVQVYLKKKKLPDPPPKTVTLTVVF